MATNSGRMTIHWIDHIAVPTNELNLWTQWAAATLGIRAGGFYGVSTEEREHNVPIHRFLPIAKSDRAPDAGDNLGHLKPHLLGIFLMPKAMPKSGAELGKGTPRYGFYIRPEDIDAHMTRLERVDQLARNPEIINTNVHGAGIASTLPYSDPVRTTIAGEEGTIIYFEDPDANQWEFWAPDQMPEGAMSDCSSLGVGRLSSGTFGCRDLQKTAEFYAKYCGLEPANTDSKADDTLVLPLAGGPRIVYQRVSEPDYRTKQGSGIGLHTALTVQADDLMPMYEKLWAALPEWEGQLGGLDDKAPQGDAPPFRTEMHGSLVGRRWKKLIGRGDYFLDDGGNAFHLHGVFSEREDGSLAVYKTKDEEEYLMEWAETKGLRMPEVTDIF